jgi:hypothetical protein
MTHAQVALAPHDLRSLLRREPARWGSKIIPILPRSSVLTGTSSLIHVSRSASAVVGRRTRSLH